VALWAVRAGWLATFTDSRQLEQTVSNVWTDRLKRPTVSNMTNATDSTRNRISSNEPEEVNICQRERLTLPYWAKEAPYR
jgi:hypothetical protein